MGLDALGSYIGGNIGAVLAGALGIETGPFALPISALGRLAGAAIGSAIEDYISLADSIADDKLSNIENDEVRYPNNPDNDKKGFETFETKHKKCIRDGSIWSRDTSDHGGKQWKRWPNKRAFKDDKGQQSIWAEDGRIRKTKK